MANLSDKFSTYGLSLATAQVEYLINTQATFNTADTTSFGYSSAGQSILAHTSAYAGSENPWVPLRVQSIVAMSATDRVTIEVSSDGIVWVDAAVQFPPMESGSNAYGIDWEPVSSTQLKVRFGKNGANGSEAWSSYTSWKWRVRVTRANLSAGYGDATTSSSGLLPPVTNMSDSLATAHGHKTYRHGTTYNGGNAPTITATSPTVSSILGSSFVPYQMQDGGWRLRFNFRVFFSAGISAGSSNTISINGVVFKNISGFRPPVVTTDVAGNYPMGGYVLPNTDDISIRNITSTTDDVILSGDVELESKPTWAY